MQNADPTRLRARGALPDGLMSNRRSDFAETIPRMTAELADLAEEGQLLITDAVEEGTRQDHSVDSAYVGRVRLMDQVVVVFEVRSAQERSSG